jgi:hypothetical protein
LGKKTLEGKIAQSKAPSKQEISLKIGLILGFLMKI